MKNEIENKMYEILKKAKDDEDLIEQLYHQLSEIEALYKSIELMIDNITDEQGFSLEDFHGLDIGDDIRKIINILAQAIARLHDASREINKL